MPAAKPKVAAHLAVVEIDGEAVIYDERTQEIHHLNPTATIVFRLCDGTATVRETSEEISKAFDVPVDVVERQVRATVASFRKVGLLGEPAPKGSSRSPASNGTAASGAKAKGSTRSARPRKGG